MTQPSPIQIRILKPTIILEQHLNLLPNTKRSLANSLPQLMFLREDRLRKWLIRLEISMMHTTVILVADVDPGLGDDWDLAD